jgi:hypothetical protein
MIESFIDHRTFDHCVALLSGARRVNPATVGNSTLIETRSA